MDSRTVNRLDLKDEDNSSCHQIIQLQQDAIDWHADCPVELMFNQLIDSNQDLVQVVVATSSAVSEQSTVAPLVNSSAVCTRRSHFQRAQSCPQEKSLPNFDQTKPGQNSISPTLPVFNDPLPGTNFGVSASSRLGRLRAFNSLDCDAGPGSTRPFTAINRRNLRAMRETDWAASELLNAKLRTIGKHYYPEEGYGHVIALLTGAILCLTDALQLSFPLLAHFMLQQRFSRNSIIHPGKR